MAKTSIKRIALKLGLATVLMGLYGMAVERPVSASMWCHYCDSYCLSITRQYVDQYCGGNGANCPEDEAQVYSGCLQDCYATCTQEPW